MTSAEARRTFPFWMIFIATMLVSIGLFIPFVHIAAFAQDIGLDERQGVWVASSIGIGSIFGRVALGPIAQAFGRQPVVVALYLGLGVAYVGWNFSTALYHLLLFGFVFGTLYGGFVALAPTLVADYFGVGHIGSVVGLVYASVAVGALIGPAIAGDLFDQFGTYQVAILSGAALCLVAAVLVMLPRNPARWRAERFGLQEG
jgi:MFS family permease